MVIAVPISSVTSHPLQIYSVPINWQFNLKCYQCRSPACCGLGAIDNTTRAGAQLRLYQHEFVHHGPSKHPHSGLISASCSVYIARCADVCTTAEFFMYAAQNCLNCYVYPTPCTSVTNSTHNIYLHLTHEPHSKDVMVGHVDLGCLLVPCRLRRIQRAT